MEHWDFIDLNSIIENISQKHAHTNAGKQTETLEEHLTRTREYMLLLSEKKGIGEIVEGIIDGLLFEEKALPECCKMLLKRMFANAIYLHDIGKINPAFQKFKMKNPWYSQVTFSDSEHSIVSALIYIDIFDADIQKISDKSLKYYMYNILYSFAYEISRHHSYLKDTYEFTDKLLQKQDLKYFKDYKSCTLLKIRLGSNNPFDRRFSGYEAWKMDGLDFYILNRLLFAMIISCDYYATFRYQTENPIDLGLIDNIDEMLSIYSSSKIYKGIEAYRNDKSCFSNEPINALRSELFIEAEQTLLSNMDRQLFYLEAPTGGGKTNISINLALNIVKNNRQYNKIFYIFPFNTLIEQTQSTFARTFGDKLNFAVVNSVTPIVTKEEEMLGKGDSGVNYDDSYLNRQFLHYPVVLTTHINFFNYLFGTGREVCYPLVHLCNSVIILDEIQSYKTSLWTEMIMFLSKYSELLHIKIIIMSATLPKLHMLLEKGNSGTPVINLIKDRDRYFKNKLFKDRVKLDFSMLDEKVDLVTLSDKLGQLLRQKGRPLKILFEFIKKDTARDFYNLINGDYPGKVIELSGDDNKYFRDRAIERIKNSSEIIVVATQVIEAGIDIDMDIGFKDISILDSDEQFLGRINRSCLRNNCVGYFFNLDKTENIYRGDFRIGKDLRSEEYRDMLKNKDFDIFYSFCLKRIEENKNELNENNINWLLEKARNLEFRTVQEHMKLIDQHNLQLYIPYRVKIEDKVLDGNEIWTEYKELCCNKQEAYAKKQVDLSHLRERMLYFTYNLSCYDKKVTEPPIYTEEFSGYFYIENGKEYITEDGKFDRRKYLKDTGGLFL